VIGSGTPTIDRLAALAVRRRISREGGRVYLDSAWAQTDSSVVRWESRGGRPLTVAFAADSSLVGWNSSFVAAARAGMAAWQSNRAGLRFQEVADAAAADIEVSFVQHVSAAAEFGVTELRWDAGGRVTHAAIRLALSPDSTVRLVPVQVMRRVAIHEFGHAIGLPHSSNNGDIMLPSSPVDQPSSRDQATLQLLYAVPIGPLRTQ
jgi:predicted Zn-dependent protease